MFAVRRLFKLIGPCSVDARNHLDPARMTSRLNNPGQRPHGRAGLARGSALACGFLFVAATAAAVLHWQSNDSDTAAVEQQPYSRATTADKTAPTTNGLTQVKLAELKRPQTPAEKLADRHDATTDDWDMEKHGQRIDDQLSRLAQLLISPKSNPGSTGLSRFITSGATSSRLIPAELTTVLDDELLSVRRADLDPVPEPNGSLEAELIRLMAGIGMGIDAEKKVKFKLINIRGQGDGLETRILFEARFRTLPAAWQLTSTWLCEWIYEGFDGEVLPVIDKLKLEAYEDTQIQSTTGRLFEDVTKAVLGKNAAYKQQVIPGIPFWLSRIQREFMGQFGHHGIAVGDVNGDRLDDVYVCDAGGLPNRLYIQQPDGTAVDVSQASQVDFLEDSTAALFIDLDNDGDQDLVVATDPLIQICENDGTGRFQTRESLYANTDTYSLCAADYDRDRDLDVYVCGYSVRKRVSHGLPFPLPYHDANNGGSNFLLRNDGKFKFADVTKETGLDVNNSRFSLAAAWEDFDNDGDVDLYVANDFGRNNLFRNDDARFTDIASAAQVEDRASGMSVSWGDFNRDGWMDVYVSNMFSAAGSRVTYQRKFSEGLAAGVVASLQRMAKGNTLFANTGKVAFQDVSRQTRVTMGRWAWASKFADLNNDGWQDLVVLNGYVTNENKNDL